MRAIYGAILSTGRRRHDEGQGMGHGRRRYHCSDCYRFNEVPCYLRYKMPTSSSSSSRRWSSSLKEFCANFLRQSHDKALQQQQRRRVPLAKVDRSEVDGGRPTRREGRVIMGCYLWGHWCTSFQSITISTFFCRRRFSLWRILFFQLTVYWLRSTCRRYNVSKLLKCFVRNFKQFFGGCDAVHRI